jgi:hypothetical protein
MPNDMRDPVQEVAVVSENQVFLGQTASSGDLATFCSSCNGRCGEPNDACSFSQNHRSLPAVPGAPLLNERCVFPKMHLGKDR